MTRYAQNAIFENAFAHGGLSLLLPAPGGRD